MKIKKNWMGVGESGVERARRDLNPEVALIVEKVRLRERSPPHPPEPDLHQYRTVAWGGEGKGREGQGRGLRVCVRVCVCACVCSCLSVFHFLFFGEFPFSWHGDGGGSRVGTFAK